MTCCPAKAHASFLSSNLSCEGNAGHIYLLYCCLRLYATALLREMHYFAFFLENKVFTFIPGFETRGFPVHFDKLSANSHRGEIVFRIGGTFCAKERDFFGSPALFLWTRVAGNRKRDIITVSLRRLEHRLLGFLYCYLSDIIFLRHSRQRDDVCFYISKL